MNPPPRRYATLVADDVSALRRLVRMALEASGRFEVVAEAATGIEAIARAREAQPELVLLDLSMPEMDGLEALPRILEAAPRSHVVVLSGFNHVRMAPLAKRQGASAYLEKGLDPKDLVKALLDALEPAGTGNGAASGGPGQPPAPGAAKQVDRFMPVPDLTAREGAVPRAANAGRAAHAAAAQARPAAPTTNGLHKNGPGPRRILLVEADAHRASRIDAMLQAATAADFAVESCSTIDDAIARLRHPGIDLVLVDPDGQSTSADDTLIEILTSAAAIPVVALQPASDVDLASRAIRLGTEDCLGLDHLDPELLGRSLLYAVERRRAHAARQVVRDQERQLHRLREVEQLKDQFFNAAAHELGAPLTSIRLQVALLRRTLQSEAGSDPTRMRAFEILERNVQRLSQLDQDILDVARLQAGHFSVNKRPMQVADVVRDVTETFEAAARAAGIRLGTSCPPTLAIEADPQRLSQVLLNLVSNAVKFTPSGGMVRIEGDVVGRECRLVVRDTGLGLRPDQIEQLFQPFSQVLGPDQPRGVGTGLGLFVSRGIVELHGGRIWCESNGPGHGSAFIVALPSLEAHAVPHLETSHAIAHPEAQAAGVAG